MEELIKQLEHISEQLERLNQHDDALWDVDDISRYIKAKSTTTKKLINHRHFPAPVKLPTSENGGHNRWVAGEVKRFCLKFKG